VISTQGNAMLVLSTPYGPRVVLKGRSRLSYEGVGSRGGRPFYRFRDPTGDALFEFKAGADVELEFGSARAMASSAWLHVGQTPRTLTVLKGDARYSSGGSLTPLRFQQAVQLPPAN
jgi:hypothetical protein